MNLLLSANTAKIHAEIKITGSKSETNRLLLLQALFPGIQIENISNSDDAEVMQKGLSKKNGVVDIHHAGTAMRFLTSFFAATPDREVTLTGSTRMKERPIKILVDALRQLGADIRYLENEGFPPLRIKGQNLSGNKVTLAANVSSQYISSLLLVAPTLKNGLELTLDGQITSVPYIKMTLALLNDLGVKTSFTGNTVMVFPFNNPMVNKTFTVESDWSSASYFFSIIALCEPGSEVTLSSYKENSLQGDAVLVEIYKHFGVKAMFSNNSVKLIKETAEVAKAPFCYNLTNAPDIAQTIAVTCFGLGIGCHLTGLHTLKIKETDRLKALKTELSKLGAKIEVTNSQLTLKPASNIHQHIAIDTYNDHRMAMAFAPLALKVPIIINDAGVVSKSYPDFWDDLKQVGFHIRSF